MEGEAALAERKCIVTRETRDESALIRFVRGPSGEAVPDLARKLPGRGVWVGLNRNLVKEAQARKLFSRGFGAETKADPELAVMISGLLRKQALSYLSLARKAGEAVAGFTKVEEMLTQGKARVLAHAVEAQPDGKRKLDRLAGAEIAMIGAFRLDELDLAFGRSNVIHAAVAKGGLAERFLTAVRRMETYEALPGLDVTEERA